MDEAKQNIFAANLQMLASGEKSISEVCRKTGINRQQFARYLNGTFLPSNANLFKLCNYFGVSSDFFFQKSELPAGPVPELLQNLPKHISLLAKFNLENLAPEFQDGIFFNYSRSFSHDSMVIKRLVIVRHVDGFRVVESISPLMFQDEIHHLMETKPTIFLREVGNLSGYDGAYYMNSINIHNLNALTYSLLSRHYSRTNDYIGSISTIAYDTHIPQSHKIYFEYVADSSCLLSPAKTCGYYFPDTSKISSHILDYIL